MDDHSAQREPVEAAETSKSDQPGDAVAHDQVRQLVGTSVWYCPSRWLLAHHDPQANIQTLSSHMCLADLNNDGESLLALIDFKPVKVTNAQPVRPPYECRMRVYRGQQLIYNHFLDDMPSCLLASNVIDHVMPNSGPKQKLVQSATQLEQAQQQPILTMPINDDIYLYNRLKPSHKMSLEDEDCILDSLSKSEVDAWQMVKQNKVDAEAMRELLQSLSVELGNQELTSHTINFLALDSSEARSNYLMAWKMKKLSCGNGEHIMSMDTICCAAARLKYNSNITRSGDFGQTRESGLFLENTRWSSILDIQRNGLVVGTEDRHLLIYELRRTKTRLECHYRLPAVPDHILVERCSPANFDSSISLKDLTYQILISCRNCRIYAIDQLYLVDKRSNPCKARELVALKCNVLAMSWTGLEDNVSFQAYPQASKGVTPNQRSSNGEPLFVIACLDRRVYCFSSRSGECKWVVELELPITCLVCLPKLKVGSDDSSLVGVASEANRIDFYVASNGRVVDSIYFSRDDYPVAATFGRFGREDSCLCLVTRLGLLSIFILKRTAKFAHGQCLSSAASYASDTLANCSQVLQKSVLLSRPQETSSASDQSATELERTLKLDKPADLPSAFSLSKTSSTTAADQMINSLLQMEHKCDRVAAKSTLEAHMGRPILQIPAKTRDFVGQILEQSRQSRLTGQRFANQMVKLRDKVRSTIEMQSDLRPTSVSEGANRVLLVQVIGLGNIYRVELSLRLNLARHFEHFNQLFKDQDTVGWQLILLLIPSQNSRDITCQVKPFQRTLPVGNSSDTEAGVESIFEAQVDFKLFVLGKPFGCELAQGGTQEIQVELLVKHLSTRGETLIRKPLLITSVNVPLGS